MDREAQRRLDGIRARRTELENSVIDEMLAGRVSRREFVRAGSVIGISLPVLGAILAACSSGPTTAPSTGGVKKGGRLNMGHQTPSGPMDPILTADLGRLTILGLAGEYLSFSDKDLKLRPVLAESWSPNSDGSAWTFKIRQGVKFNDGTPMTVDDVVATFNRLADPTLKGNNALSAFSGVLTKGNVTKVDSSTVKFQLDSPNGNFPYLVSSDNYNAIILPASYSGNWDKTFIGTGPWKMKSYSVNDSVSFDRNPNYWDTSNVPPLDGIDIKFYADEQAMILAFQAGSLNVLSFFSVRGGQTLLTDPNTTVQGISSTEHRQVHMRTDQPPFDNNLVRQALAYAIDRQAVITGLFNGKAQVANDHPIFKLYPSSDPSVSQRSLDINKAKGLMAQAGKAAGFNVTLYTEKVQEIPDLAALIQAAGKQIGITIELNITDSGTYYDKYWLNSPLGITDYGHRGVPNTFLKAPLLGDPKLGKWNAAHFNNPTYDTLVADYVKAIDLPSQKAVTGKIEQLLLDQTPLIIPYTYDALTAMKKNIKGIETTGMGHVNLTKAGITS
ncbi:MAG TPA: ABC transporter substrate-binding protein [Candidatus Dormibacteraeota bacterium]|nr:ABC transporter substrate-binding protein [Candidatus Dormibacteraeota bacterium]